MVNKVILIGNLGADPEVRALETGIKMTRLRVATSERIYNSSTGERREHTEWHTVILWRGQADFADKYLQKGSKVYIEGKIRSHEWTEEATGIKRYAIEILADEIRLLGGGIRRNDNQIEHGDDRPQTEQTEEREQSTQPTPQEQPRAQQAPKDADDLPF